MRRAYAYAAWAFICVWLLLTSLFSVALNDELYDLFQRLSNVTEASCGLSDDERMTLNRDIAMFLAGRTDEIASISDRAQAHMNDVRALLGIARTTMYACFASGALLGIIAFKKCKDTIWRAYIIVPAVFACVMTAVGIYAAVDFDNAFTAFHTLTFSNDSWLLDPNTDALIRILPSGFFALAAVTTAVRGLLRIILLGALIKLIMWLIRRLNA